MKIGKYNLANEDKVYRVLHGSIGVEGKEHGGLGEDANPEDILVAYDKLGGLILDENGDKIKNGGFYDFKAKKARKKKDKDGKEKLAPVIVKEFRDKDGELFEIPEGEDMPIQVKAAKLKKKNKK